MSSYLLIKHCAFTGNKCSPSVYQAGTGLQEKHWPGVGWGSAEGFGGNRGVLFSLPCSNQHFLTSIHEMISVETLKMVKVYNVKEC